MSGENELSAENYLDDNSQAENFKNEANEFFKSKNKYCTFIQIYIYI